MNADGTQDCSAVNLYDVNSGGKFVYGTLYANSGTEALKITSKAKDITVDGIAINGGTEDCLDLNNECSGIKVHFDRWLSGGTYVVTCKGGCTDVELSGRIDKHGSVTDIDLDNASDQSTKPTRNIRLAFTTDDGSAVKVRCLGPNSPIILNQSQRYEITQDKRIGALFKLLRTILAVFGIKI